MASDSSTGRTDDERTNPWCAYAQGKQKWKAQDNYYTVAEMRAMDEITDFTLIRPLSRVLSAD